MSLGPSASALVSPPHQVSWWVMRTADSLPTHPRLSLSPQHGHLQHLAWGGRTRLSNCPGGKEDIAILQMSYPRLRL